MLQHACFWEIRLKSKTAFHLLRLQFSLSLRHFFSHYFIQYCIVRRASWSRHILWCILTYFVQSHSHVWFGDLYLTFAVQMQLNCLYALWAECATKKGAISKEAEKSIRHCGNFRILLLFRFKVISFLKNLEDLKLDL